MAKKNKEGDVCCSTGQKHCGKCRGYVLIVVGALVLANDMYAVVNWAQLAGIIAVLIGLKHAILCRCCCKSR